MNPRTLLFTVCIIVLALTGAAAREIHVAKSGSDSGPGSQSRPYLTIQQAASVAAPGDTVLVHAGTYREWVKPPRGGTSEDQRITYRAAAGETVMVKGSERITSWTREADNVWKVELRNALFGDYNPYALQVSGGWLNYGNWHHRGDVYLNGEAFLEKETARQVRDAENCWHCQADDTMTTIRAHFGNADPNKQLVEINVRESLFMPEVSGLKYITVDGFHFLHAAANWAPPGLELQPGAVGPRMGKHWIIENCRIVNARAVGIILGQAPGVDYTDIDAFGDHMIRNNIIRRCGQAGIAGQKGATRSLIAGNLIEDTNYRKEFGGWETAAIKFHNSVDTVIRGNLIRGVYHQQQGAYGIWMDYGNQGTRITANIIYDTMAENVFLEMNHGPTLVDNNVLIGGGLKGESENNVFAHNLYVDSGYAHRTDMERQSQYYTPHTTKVVGRKPGVPRNEQWFNNIFIRLGLGEIKEAPGYVADYNIFLEGAKKSAFGDEDSIGDPFVTEFKREDQPAGVTITFQMNDAPFRVEAPWIDAERVGVFPTAGQTIEDRDGKPIRVDTDLNGRKYTHPIPGPLSDLKQGLNTIVWSHSSAAPKVAGDAIDLPKGLAARYPNDAGIGRDPNVVFADDFESWSADGLEQSAGTWHTLRKNDTSRTHVISGRVDAQGAPGPGHRILEIACWSKEGQSQVGGLSRKLGNYNHTNEGLGDGHDDLYVRYYIRFDENYRAVQNHGASLGGRDLSMKDPAWVGMAAIRDVASRGYFYSNLEPHGEPGATELEMGFYSYHMDKKGPWGDAYGVQKRLPIAVGTWHCVERHIRLNSVANGEARPDGLEELWIDGVRSIRKEGLRFRRSPPLKVALFTLETYYHGLPAEFGEANPIKVCFDNVVIARRYIGPIASQ